MSSSAPKRISTIVQILVFGASISLGNFAWTARTPLDPEVTDEPVSSEAGDPSTMEGMTVPRPVDSVRKLSRQSVGDGYYYPFRKHFTGGGGFGGFIPKQTSVSFFATYGWIYSNLAFLETSGEIYSGGQVNGGFEVRYLKFSNKTRTRPFWTAGGALLYASKDQLVSFLKLENYELRGTLGIDYTVGSVFALRAEARLGFALSGGFRDRLTVGLVWPW